MRDNVVRRVRTYGIFSNTLKIIALIAMVIDHIAFYFDGFIPTTLVSVMRAFGRIAMPLFVYLLVQGFFKTRNFSRYVTRVGICAVVTQIVLSVLMYINKEFYPSYVTGVYKIGNILFSFVLTLLLLKVIHEPLILKKYTKDQNIIVRIILGICIFSVYTFIDIDYGTTIPIFGMILYAIERFKITVLMTKSSQSFSLMGVVINAVDEAKIDKIYKLLVAMSFLLIVMFCNESVWIMIALLPILLYNGEKKNQRRRSKAVLLHIFPTSPCHFIFTCNDN